VVPMGLCQLGMQGYPFHKPKYSKTSFDFGDYPSTFTFVTPGRYNSNFGHELHRPLFDQYTPAI